MKTICKIYFLISFSYICVYAANDGMINNAEILGICVINAPCYGHTKSGFEFSIKDNITWPSNVAYGNAYESTTEFSGISEKVWRIDVNSNAPEYKSMLATLLTAKAIGSKVLLIVTDDQTLNTHPGRPSLKAVMIK